MKHLLLLAALALSAFCTAMPATATAPAAQAATLAHTLYDLSAYGQMNSANAIVLSKDMLRLAAATGSLLKAKGLDTDIIQELDKIRIYTSRQSDFRERMTTDIAALQENLDYEEGSLTVSAKDQTHANMFSHMEGEYITELLVFVSADDIAIVAQITGQMTPESVAQIVKAVAQK